MSNISQEVSQEVKYTRADFDPKIIKSYRPTHGVTSPVPPQGGSGLVPYESNGDYASDSADDTVRSNLENCAPMPHE